MPYVSVFRARYGKQQTPIYACHVPSILCLGALEEVQLQQNQMQVKRRLAGWLLVAVGVQCVYVR